MLRRERGCRTYALLASRLEEADDVGLGTAG